MRFRLIVITVIGMIMVDVIVMLGGDGGVWFRCCVEECSVGSVFAHGGWWEVEQVDYFLPVSLAISSPHCIAI